MYCSNVDHTHKNERVVEINSTEIHSLKQLK